MNECEKEKRRMVKAANLQAHSVFRQLLVMFAEAVNSATRATILLYISITSIITSTVILYLVKKGMLEKKVKWTHVKKSEIFKINECEKEKHRKVRATNLHTQITPGYVR